MIRLYRRRLFDRGGHPTIDGRASAIVFAPHPDDETLGCGGTIAIKRRQNADVSVVVMTDGSDSHTPMIGRDKLVEIRASEVRAATGELGVEPDRLFLLGYPDGALSDNLEQAAAAVQSIIRERSPREIYLPYRGDIIADHVSTYRIVVRAVKESGFRGRLYEYPVWFWMQWPFCQQRAGNNGGLARLLSSTLISNLRLLYSFNDGQKIADVIEVKRAALNEHRSQMTRLTGDEEWPILQDVAGGEFISCFLQDHEIFRRTDVR